MSNITKELKAHKTEVATKMQQDSAVKSVLLLQESSSLEDIRIATALGSKHNISRAQDKLGHKINLENLDQKYAGNVFTRAQIKKLAGKYNMRFLHSDRYCGNLDLEVIQKLKAFSKETGVEITDGNLKYNFLILAPENCFHLDKVERMRKDPDPAIFYKIDEGHYRLIHQWGSDFNIFNRIAGMYWYNRVSKFFVTLIVLALIFGTVMSIIDHFTFVHQLWYIIPSLVLFGASIGNSQIWEDRDYHNSKWNSTDQLT